MSTPNQLSATPRTDAAWAETFEADEHQYRAGNAATDMRDECAKIETELAALTAERDQLRAELAELHTSFAGNVHTRCNQLAADLTAERERVRVLRDALENLRDEQNGAPLFTREEQWTQAMDRADAGLAATEESK